MASRSSRVLILNHSEESLNDESSSKYPFSILANQRGAGQVENQNRVPIDDSSLGVLGTGENTSFPDPYTMRYDKSGQVPDKLKLHTLYRQN